MRNGWMRGAVYAALMAAAGTATAAEGFTLEGEPKIAMLYFGDKNDGGWTQSFDEARIKVEQELGVKIQFVEKIPESASSIKPAAERFIARGANIIIGTAFGYSDTFTELADKYPNVAFLNGNGTSNNGRNLESIYGRTYESHYLCGMAAAAMSKTGKLGFVAANPFGSVNWTVNAFEMGARQINPEATTTVIFTGAWNDPVKERAAAMALIDQGAEVIGQHVDTPTPQIVASERGKFATGHHRDLSEFAPKATLCSAAWNWEKFLIPELKTIIAGEWKPAPGGAFLSIEQGGGDIAFGQIELPAEARAKIEAERQAIIDGKSIYAGPLNDREGNERVAEGEVLSDAALWQMDWYVDGVITQK